MCKKGNRLKVVLYFYFTISPFFYSIPFILIIEIKKLYYNRNMNSTLCVGENTSMDKGDPQLLYMYACSHVSV